MSLTINNGIGTITQGFVKAGTGITYGQKIVQDGWWDIDNYDLSSSSGNSGNKASCPAKSWSTNGTRDTGYLIARLPKMEYSSECHITSISVSGTITGTSNSSATNTSYFYVSCGYDLDTSFSNSTGGYAATLTSPEYTVGQTTCSGKPTWSTNFDLSNSNLSDYYTIDNLIQHNSGAHSIFLKTFLENTLYQTAYFHLSNLKYTITFTAKSKVRIYYRPYSNVKYEYIANAGSNIVLPNTYSLTYTGYRGKNWLCTEWDNTHSLYTEWEQSTLPQATVQDIDCEAQYDTLYQVIFNSSLNGVTVDYTQSSYNQMLADAVVQKPTDPSTPAYQFMGWTSDSTKTIYDPTWHDTNLSTNKFWNTSTNLPNVANSQAGSTPTTAGFPINYYAVWQERDSVTINENISNVATISVTNSAATSGNTYYFNPSQSIAITISVTSESYYLDTITSTTSTNLITNGSTDTDQKIWTSGTITSGTSGTAITINVVYVEGYTAFYGKENVSTPQRVIKIYWEDTRAVDLYYENTRLI